MSRASLRLGSIALATVVPPWLLRLVLLAQVEGGSAVPLDDATGFVADLGLAAIACTLVLTALRRSQLAGLSMLPGRLAAVLVGAFGLVGILLAAIGLYGLLAFSVAQQSREIGVHLALGAEPRRVRRMIVMRGLRLTGAGLLVGLFGAAGVAQLLSNLLFGISPFDPATYLTIAAILMAVATVACWLPARRAAATDPVVALRAE